MYAKEVQELALADYKSGRSVREICEKYKISRSCLYKWIKSNEVRRDKKTENEFTYKQLEILQRQVYKLIRENEILRFACEHLNPNLKQKLEIADLLYAVKIGQSLSKAGTPYDNSVMEAFFSNLKQDDLNSCEFEEFDELVAVVNRYVEFYNSYRPHEFLGYKTPDEVEMEYKELENFVPF